MMNNTSIPVLMMFAVSAYTGIAHAQGSAGVNPALSERVQFRVGPFFTNIDSSVDVQKVEFDLDDRLGDNQTTVAVAGFVRLSRRLRINMAYFGVDREESETLSEPLGIGPVDVPAGTEFSSKFENTDISGGLGWSFLSNDTTELGADVNVSIVTLENRITTTVPGFPTVELNEFDVTEPMPSIGLFFQHAFSQQWSVGARAGAIGFDISNIKGKIYNAKARVDFRPWRNVGFGVSYIYSKADLEIESDDGVRDIKYTYQGPFAFIVLGFGSVR